VQSQCRLARRFDAARGCAMAFVAGRNPQRKEESNMNTENIGFIVVLAVAVVVAWSVLRARYLHEFVVNDGLIGLIYRNGKLMEAVKAGRHFRWGKVYRIALIDARNTLLPVAGQEVLSADGISIKISVVVTSQIIDAIKAVQTVDNYTAHLYSAAQNALREVTAGLAMDVLINQRVAIASDLRERLAPFAHTIGLKLHAVEVRDIMLSADLRRAFSETLKAKQEGQAALERARGESAALRNLANAARLLEGQPALVTLRFLQTLAEPGTKQMLVMNDISAFVPAVRAAKNVAPAKDA
jgi:regulator of protease activity HflC (stomatin/prohibitin superfamily)